MAATNPSELCKVPECEGQPRGLGYCSGHYQRVKKHGNPQADIPLQQRVRHAGLACSVQGCIRPVINGVRALCGLHYHRVWRDPEADLLAPAAAPRKRPVAAVDLPDGRRLCQGCQIVKPLSDFHKDSRSPLGRRKTCKPCRVATETERYWRDPASASERVRAFRAANPEHVRLRESRYYEMNRDARIEAATEAANRRRASAYAGPRDHGISKSALRRLDGDACCYCSVEMIFQSFAPGDRADSQATLEHVRALSRGGLHVWDNCALACWRCNISKGARDGDWRIRDGHRLAVVEAAVGT